MKGSKPRESSGGGKFGDGGEEFAGLGVFRFAKDF
jgi:hypothetical protein